MYIACKYLRISELFTVHISISFCVLFIAIVNN
jgi:hypothetical protein